MPHRSARGRRLRLVTIGRFPVDTRNRLRLRWRTQPHPSVPRQRSQPPHSGKPEKFEACATLILRFSASLTHGPNPWPKVHNLNLAATSTSGRTGSITLICLGSAENPPKGQPTRCPVQPYRPRRHASSMRPFVSRTAFCRTPRESKLRFTVFSYDQCVHPRQDHLRCACGWRSLAGTDRCVHLPLPLGPMDLRRPAFASLGRCAHFVPCIQSATGGQSHCQLPSVDASSAGPLRDLKPLDTSSAVIREPHTLAHIHDNHVIAPHHAANRSILPEPRGESTSCHHQRLQTSKPLAAKCPCTAVSQGTHAAQNGIGRIVRVAMETCVAGKSHLDRENSDGPSPLYETSSQPKIAADNSSQKQRHPEVPGK